jgi:hypothetical protein
MGVRIMQQSITAGNNFDGTAPPGSLTHVKDMDVYAAAATGGLFDFALTEPMLVYQIELVLGGQSAWTLKLTDIDNIDIVVWTGTTENSFITTAADRILIHEGQKLKLTTTGASGALRARIAVGTVDRR